MYLERKCTVPYVEANNIITIIVLLSALAFLVYFLDKRQVTLLGYRSGP